MRPASAKDLDQSLRLLFEQALAGDEAAYSAFLEQVAALLRKFLWRSQNVEDLVQDILLTVHRKRDLYRRGMPVIPWLRAIARHRLVDHLRAEARSPKTSNLDDWLEHEFVSEKLESSVDLELLLANLSERQRQILVQAKVEELSHSEIGVKFGMSVSAVKVSVHRSLGVLRKSLYGKK